MCVIAVVDDFPLHWGVNAVGVEFCRVAGATARTHTFTYTQMCIVTIVCKRRFSHLYWKRIECDASHCSITHHPSKSSYTYSHALTHTHAHIHTLTRPIHTPKAKSKTEERQQQEQQWEQQLQSNFLSQLKNLFSDYVSFPCESYRLLPQIVR